jgi:hypothetical protein
MPLLIYLFGTVKFGGVHEPWSQWNDWFVKHAPFRTCWVAMYAQYFEAWAILDRMEKGGNLAWWDVSCLDDFF